MLKGMNSLKAIFFDLFETLITEFSHGKRISNRQYDYKELLNLESYEFKKAWTSRQRKRMTGELENFVEVIEDIMNELNMPVNYEAIEYLYQERIKEKSIPFEIIHSDIIELLQFLKGENIRTGLISNCSEEEVRFWNNSELPHFFDSVIFSYAVGIAKPDKDIYLLGCKELAVDPRDSIFIGDGGSNELDGAVNAGMISYHATWFNPTIDSLYKKFDSPRDLVDQLKQKIY